MLFNNWLELVFQYQLTVRDTNSQVSELIAKHWIEGQSFDQLRRIQILELEGRQVLTPVGLFQVVFKFLQVFAPYLPHF